MPEVKTTLINLSQAKDYRSEITPQNINVLPRDPRGAVISVNTGRETRAEYLLGSTKEVNRVEVLEDVSDESGRKFHHFAIISNAEPSKRKDIFVPNLTSAVTSVINLEGKRDVIIPVILQEDDGLAWSELRIPLVSDGYWSDHKLFEDLLGVPETPDNELVHAVMGDWLTISHNKSYNILPGIFPDIHLPTTDEEWNDQRLRDYLSEMSNPDSARALIETQTAKPEPANRSRKIKNRKVVKELAPRKVKSEAPKSKESPSKVRTVGASETGSTHQQEQKPNEDFKYSILDYVNEHPDLREKIWNDIKRKGLVYLVADGVGGHNGGSEASAIATRAFFDSYYSKDKDVVESMEEANRVVYHTQISSPELYGMSTTFAAIRVNLTDDPNQYTVDTFNVGDSPIYGVTGTNVIKGLFYEDSWVNTLVQMGEVDPEDAKTNKLANIITSSVGAKLQVNVHAYYQVFTINGNNFMMLYTDGVDDTTQPGEVVGIYRQTRNARAVESEFAAECSQVSGARKKGDDSTIDIVDLKTILDTLFSLNPNNP